MNDDCKQRQYSDQVHQPSAGQEGTGGRSHDCVPTVCSADIIAFSPHHSNILGFPGGAVVKNPHAIAADSRDKSLIPGSGRSPGVGRGNPLQYSCLENSSTEGPGGLQFVGVTKSKTRLSAHTHSNTYRVDFIIPILEMKSLRAREVRFFSQDLTSTKSQRPTPDLPAC